MNELLSKALRAAKEVMAAGPRGASAAIAIRSADGIASCGVPEAGVDPGAPFLIYSVTKSFIAVAILRLVARGTLSLDLPLALALPDAPAPAAHVSLRQLLSHTSGLPDYGGLARYHAAVREGGEPWTEEEFLSLVRTPARRPKPGRFAYSNLGYLLLKRVLELHCGGFATGLHELAIEPAGLEHTFVAEDRDLARLTFGPSEAVGGKAYSTRWVAHGVLASTAEDVARFFEALVDGKLLPGPLFDELTKGTEVPAMAGRPWIRPAYGLGVQMDLAGPGGLTLGHGGGGPGCSAAVEAREALAVAVLTTTEDLPQAERAVRAAFESCARA
jgi:CubicO group peptidase (beta-lactamase class C family)